MDTPPGLDLQEVQEPGIDLQEGQEAGQDEEDRRTLLTLDSSSEGLHFIQKNCTSSLNLQYSTVQYSTSSLNLYNSSLS